MPGSLISPTQPKIECVTHMQILHSGSLATAETIRHRFQGYCNQSNSYARKVRAACGRKQLFLERVIGEKTNHAGKVEVFVAHSSRLPGNSRSFSGIKSTFSTQMTRSRFVEMNSSGNRSRSKAKAQNLEHQPKVAWLILYSLVSKLKNPLQYKNVGEVAFSSFNTTFTPGEERLVAELWRKKFVKWDGTEVDVNDHGERGKVGEEAAGRALQRGTLHFFWPWMQNVMHFVDEQGSPFRSLERSTEMVSQLVFGKDHDGPCISTFCTIYTQINSDLKSQSRYLKKSL